jgi:hypothetical protein
MLIARLGKIKEEKEALIAQKELINHELGNFTHDEQGIQAMITVTRDDFLKNQSRYKVIDHQWAYFAKFFTEFKSRIQD